MQSRLSPECDGVWKKTQICIEMSGDVGKSPESSHLPWKRSLVLRKPNTAHRTRENPTCHAETRRFDSQMVVFDVYDRPNYNYYYSIMSFDSLSLSLIGYQYYDL